MFRKIYLYILLIVFHCTAFSDQNIEIYFYADNNLKEFPTRVLEKLQDTNLNNLDEKIIKELIRTGGYDNVVTNQYISMENNPFFIVSAETSQKIFSIRLIGVDDNIIYKVQRSVDVEVGNRYNNTTLKRLENKVRKELRNSGYLSATVTKTELNTSADGLINIDITVDRGKLCLIQQIVMPTAFQNFMQLFDFPLEVGQPCSIPDIEDGLAQIQENYWSEGYLQAVVEIEKMEYTKEKDKATVYVKVDKGNKTVLQINDFNNNVFKSDFFDPKSGGLTYSDLISMSDTDLRTAIVDFYQKQGFASAKVSPPKRYKDKKDRNVIAFDVIKGPPATINEVFFVGKPLPITEKEILKQIKFKIGTKFNKDSLIVHKNEFKKIVYSYGYNDADIYDFDFYFSGDKKLVNIIIRYDLNTQFIVSSVKFKNFPKDIKIPQKELKKILTVGDPVAFIKREELANKLHTLLVSHGYLYAEVKGNMDYDATKLKKPKTLVNVIYDAETGPLVHVTKILVEGDTFGKSETIKSISKLRVGQVFTQKKLDNAQKYILKHDLFSSAVIDFLDPFTIEKKKPDVTLIIKVRGRKGLNFSLAPAYGSGTGYRSDAILGVNNITSQGLRLSLDAGVRQAVQQQNFELSNSKQLLGQNYSIGLSEPLFKFFGLQTPIDVALVGGYQVVAESLVNRRITTIHLFGEWKPTFWGADISLSLSLDQGDYLSLSLPNQATALFDAPRIMIRDITPRLKIDSRNNAGWPTKGFYFSGGIGIGSFAFGSDLNYVNYVANLKYYFPIYKKLSGGIYFGITQVEDIKNRKNQALTVPANLRTYLIEDALIRGFPDNYIYTNPGPLLWMHALNQSDVCSTQLQGTGGTKMIYLKAEARYRINENFGVVLFGDSGTNYFTAKEINTLNSALQALPPPLSPDGSLCIIDQAALVPTPPIEGGIGSFIPEYWDKAYMSTGIGLRIILGSFMTVNLDYGYPLKDPSQHQEGCVSIGEATAPGRTSPPRCVNRIQNSQLFTDKIKYRGAVHFGIEASL